MREKWHVCSSEWKLKRNDTGTKIYGCQFKLHRYCNVDEIWKFNVISRMHNHVLQTKLVGYPIVCRLKPEETEIMSNMSLIRVAPRNILADLKHKYPESVSNIKQVHNARHRNNMAIRGLRSE